MLRMSYECKKNNHHSNIIVVDDCIMEKPYIKQNYMGGRSSIPP
jgi:hypothetical protein